MAIQIQYAQPDQLTALAQLLTQNHLLANDLPDGLPNFWLAFDDDKLIGSVGIEGFGNVGLLRSVCVDADYRNQAIARQLYNIALQETRRQGVQDLYLLTTTADRYFDRLGFVRVPRTSVPESIQKTSQFSSLCPSSAVVMKQSLYPMKQILVLCTGNSARSQMAHGYLQQFADDRAEVFSAGVAPHGVNPLAVQVMAEDGIDISHHTSNHADEYTHLPLDYVITVCDNAREQCPYFPSSARKIHHSFTDSSHAPGEDRLAQFRIVRDEIKAFSQEFINQNVPA